MLQWTPSQAQLRPETLPAWVSSVSPAIAPDSFSTYRLSVADLYTSAFTTMEPPSRYSSTRGQEPASPFAGARKTTPSVFDIRSCFAPKLVLEARDHSPRRCKSTRYPFTSAGDGPGPFPLSKTGPADGRFACRSSPVP